MTVKIGDILVGIDIGTAKTCAVIGEVTPQGLDIIGLGSKPSSWMQKGAVTNIDGASQVIERALNEAEAVAGFDTISSVIVNITGNHIQGFNSDGVAPVKNPEITDEDVARVLESAKAVAIPPDREFLHVLAQEYTLDGQSGIRNPKGMCGVRLEARVHIVTGSINCAQNIINCINRCRLEVEDLVLSSLAASEAVLTEDEKELGCALVDIGGGTTDMAIWTHGSLVHTHVLGVGGYNITSDIAQALKIPLKDAEKLKILSGYAMTSAVPADDVILIPTADDRDPPRKMPAQALAEIIEPRLEEILEMVNREIEKSGYKQAIPGGIVLTGGTSIMNAAPELAQRTFGLPVRRGMPYNVGGFSDHVANPQYSTAVGLMLYAMNRPDVMTYNPQDAQKSSIIHRIVSWLKTIV